MYDDNGWEGVNAVGNNDMGLALTQWNLNILLPIPLTLCHTDKKKVS